MHIDEKRKLIFIHNPKTGGTSLRCLLTGFAEPISHAFPSRVPVDKWNSYYSIVFVRNPFDRLVSSYEYHRDLEYRGAWYKRFPFIHDLSIEDYFELAQENGIAPPSYRYTTHDKSTKRANFIGRFETLVTDAESIRQRFNIGRRFPFMKSFQRRSFWFYFRQREFVERVVEYYEKDFRLFGYSRNVFPMI